jgi:hypothetical protein
MKQLLLFLFMLNSMQQLVAQNVGIGTAEPLNKLHVNGNLLVNTPTTATSTAPTVGQTKTIVNASTLSFVNTDSIGRIYDPGGPSGNYIPNLVGNVHIPFGTGAIAIELTAETMQLGTGDSLIIKEFSSSADYLLAVGNGYTGTGKWVFNASSLYIIFKSNADANVGSGFSLLFRRLYDNSALLPDIGGITGRVLFFDTKKGALRSGRINNDLIGDYSTAMGYFPTASGAYSTAIGQSSTASGIGSTAMGSSTASGSYSTAIGSSANATGSSSIAMGSLVDASGISATAIGKEVIASGTYSTAIGKSTEASNSYSTALGYFTNATGIGSTAMGYYSVASGFSTTALGNSSTASGDYSTALGLGAISRGYAGTAIGMFNNPIFGVAQTITNDFTPLFMVGNGNDYNNRSNAMMVRKDGNVGIGTDLPTANLHIKHASGGGLILENASDNNKWRIYSASGDNNLTFYNNAGSEVADIDDVTGTFNAISDSRLKKNIESMQPVLPLLMKLNPTYYQFNWQQPNEQRQIGLLAQQAHQLFPELVSYSKEKDLYKMNYAGFSTVAIKAIQEQQLLIEKQQQQIDELKILVNELMKKK